MFKPNVSIISIWLEFYEDSDIHMYFCPACRNPVMQYKGEVVMEIPGLHESNTPLIVECSNPRCRRRYQFLGFAYPVNSIHEVIHPI